jgi:transposase InsO family protein
VVNTLGISPNPKKIESVQNFPTPVKLKDVRSFTGLASFFRKFVPGFSKIARPLTLLTRKNTPFHWGEDQAKAFETLKAKLVTAPILRHFSETLETELHTDASTLGLGAILMQRFEGSLHPISYASRSLSDQEKIYHTTHLECLAVVWAIGHFRQYLWGRFFKVIVDHHALCFLHRNTEVGGQLARWSIKLQDYDFKIFHKSGRLHGAPDCLSRYPLEATDPPVTSDILDRDDHIFALDVTNIASLQQADAGLSELIAAVKDPDKASSKLSRQSRSYLLVDDVLYKKNFAFKGETKVLVIPDSLKYEILFSLHDDPLSGGHLGYAKTFGKVKERFFWQGMAKETENYVKSCPDCQARKRPTQKPPGLLQPIPVGKPFDRVGIDLLGPFPKTPRGNTFIICCTDYATRWVITKCLPTGGSADVAQFIIENVICIFSCPVEILSDRGQVFRSHLVMDILKGLGTRSTFTSSYHPCCNGLTEKFNGLLAQMLSLYVSTDHKNWDLFVHLVTFSFNTAVQETTRFTPFYLMFGRQATLPIDVGLGLGLDLSEDAAHVIERVAEARTLAVKRINEAQSKQKARFDAQHRHVEYAVGQLVKVFSPTRQVKKSEKLLKRWNGPFKVVRKVSDVNYVVAIRKGKKMIEDIIHVVRMKPFYSPDNWRLTTRNTKH